MKPCWKQAGLTHAGAKIADKVLSPMTVALELAADRRMAELVLREAIFRRFDLPLRSEKYQRDYMKKNGVK
jgi:hypothetical protein